MNAVGDPVVAALRAEITALDARLIETINERIETVEKLRLYKEQHDLPFVDPEREAALIRELKSANARAALRRRAAGADHLRPRPGEAGAGVEWLT